MLALRHYVQTQAKKHGSELQQGLLACAAVTAVLHGIWRCIYIYMCVCILMYIIVFPCFVYISYICCVLSRTLQSSHYLNGEWV